MAGRSENIKQKDAVYVVETTVIDEDEGTQTKITGGGVCISLRGLIITTATVIPANYEQVMVRSRNSTSFRPATVFDINFQFDIAFLVIGDIEPDEIFGWVDVGDNLAIEEGEALFSWIHSDNIVFSLITGNVAFPFESVVFPPFTSKDTMGGATPDELILFREHAFSQTLSFRTIGGIVMDVPGSEGWNQVSHLHPQLPVIEVHGFFCSPGSYGSPVFDIMGRFIGLIMLEYSQMNYVLPSNLIRSYISQKHRKFKDFITIQGTEPSASSSSRDGAESSHQKKGKNKKRKKDRVPPFPGGGHDELTAEGEMTRYSDAQPGGYGTHAELLDLEVMMNAQLGIHDEPVGSLDVDGYYNYVLSCINKALEEGFINHDIRNYILSMPTTEQMVEILGEYVQLGGD